MGFAPDTLRDRVALVTGASQGIGRAIAVELAKVGAHVVVCSRRLDALEWVAAEVRGLGRKALAAACRGRSGTGWWRSTSRASSSSPRRSAA
jgi:NAD(P)-dependent dehydrogenase (short-subunit alcohol dehydrogenase family)